MTEEDLLKDADRRAARYLSGVGNRNVYPNEEALQSLKILYAPLPLDGFSAENTLALLDEVGSPATVVTNGPRYFGFVVGALLPAAAAAERLALSWDQCASSFDNSPISAEIEKIATGWLLEILDLPKESAVGFGTSATASTIACLATARRALLSASGWDLDKDGLYGSPEIKVIVSDKVHITVRKALRVLGFGENRLKIAPTDEYGRILPDRLPEMDRHTILCLQAGEVNTGEFDPFAMIIPTAKKAGAWVHVDGAFGLWSRTVPSLKVLTEGIDQADSWTCDGHKWLNTTYDSAMAICRHANEMAQTMNSDAAYATADKSAQKNLTLEFSRKARGLPIWAVLRTLGRKGVATMIERHCQQAKRLAEGLLEAGYHILNRVPINQVLVRGPNDEATLAIRDTAEQAGIIWFGRTIWQDRPAFRLSVCSWRTTDADIERAIIHLTELMRHHQSQPM